MLPSRSPSHHARNPGGERVNCPIDCLGPAVSLYATVCGTGVTGAVVTGEAGGDVGEAGGSGGAGTGPGLTGVGAAPPGGIADGDVEGTVGAGAEVAEPGAVLGTVP